MVPDARKKYNEQFTDERYDAFLADLQAQFPGHLEFRIAETPVFIPRRFRQQVLDACESILDVITAPDYLRKSQAAIPHGLQVPGEDAHPHFIVFDFGICRNADGALEPQLIEMQGFPTMFAYQVLLPEIMARHFDLPEGYDHFLNGFDRRSYIDLMRKVIIAGEDPANVVLLEIFPHRQKTRVDFYATENYLGIQTVCLTELIQEGKKLFYNRQGKKTPIYRIYNRLIFDDLFQQPAAVQDKGKLFQQELDVTWVPHPNWFYRYSKFSLPFIRHPFVPPSSILHEVTEVPDDLNNYVVKHLFSFAGQGVIIDVTRKDIDAIKDKEQWIIQRKVQYAAAVETPDEPAKAELRMFYFWEPGAKRPVATNNLARLSKGKMIGVRYNQDKTWVGGSFCLFEK